jgi:hypothetical protein
MLYQINNDDIIITDDCQQWLGISCDRCHRDHVHPLNRVAEASPRLAASSSLELD